MTDFVARKGRWPLGLLGALAAIVAVESILGRHEYDFMTPSRLEWRQSADASVTAAKDAKVIGLGTSMTKLGFYPKVIAAEAGRPGYNLACAAGRLPGAYFLLRRAIEAGARPEVVVLEVNPSYLAMPYDQGMLAWPDLLTLGESVELAWSGRSATFFAGAVVPRLLPSVKSRHEIRAAILAGFDGKPGLTGGATAPHLRNLERNDGAFVRRREAPYDGSLDPYLAGMYLNPAWAVHPLNEAYLRWLLDLCRSHHIKTYWLIPPLVPVLQLAREQVGLDLKYVGFARKIMAMYPELTVIDARHAQYPPDVFWDATHLDSRGGAIFSAEVGRVIRGKGPTAGNRWVDLPPCRDQPTDAPLEDIMQSFREEAARLKR